MTYKSDILITGVFGMVGSHFLEKFNKSTTKVIGTYYNPTVNMHEIETDAVVIECDVRYSDHLRNIIIKYLPKKIFHLAAQSYPVVSWERPEETMHINAVGTINVFEAVKSARQIFPQYDPVVVVACSSAEYGASLTPENSPVHEDTLLLPLHPYGVSKVAQDLLSFQYFVNDRIKTIRARIFNTTGSRKKNDVISDFAKQIVCVERKKLDKIKVGNLKSKRAILDVHDLIEALLVLSDKGVYGEAYNICSDKVHTIQEILDIFNKVVGLRVNYEIDPMLLRKSDEDIIYGDISKICKDTNWKPTIGVEQTISKVISYYRKSV